MDDEDSEGQIGSEICLLDSASKGKSGRRIPPNEEVRKALIAKKRNPTVASISGLRGTPDIIETAPNRRE